MNHDPPKTLLSTLANGVVVVMEIKYLLVKAHVRYWEDSTINGIEDTENGENIPCKQGEMWCPKIDIATGIIQNWEIGKTANIHYKVADCCGWELLDKSNSVISSQEDGYVPNTLSPAERGYGDYIIMNINENGQIDKWKFSLNDFQND
ncbi:hypothetical protein [Acinetobacter guillouiae]|uniref:hypothetical protein n=2 Tax=Acinetobacter TaxID=469 RepID=UPI003AF9A397